MRGRRTRNRLAAEAATSASQKERQADSRPRIPDLAGLPGLLAETGELLGLAERFQLARQTGRDLRHVAYASIPHGAKTYLAAALALATGERLAWVARDAEIADRVAEELQAWLGGAAAVVVLEPRTALAYERSELVRDETAARVAALTAWRRGRARVLVAGVQALLQHTALPDALPAEPLTLRRGSDRKSVV